MADPSGVARSGEDSTPETLLTRELLQRAKDGDRAALEHLLARYVPRLRQWASGRLPAYARSLLDTSDLVQETLLRVFQGLDRIEVRGPGGFQAYVRQAVLNRIKDQVRWASRRSAVEDAGQVEIPDPGPSPLELAIGSDLLERFEAGMRSLDEENRQLLHLRIELHLDYDEIAAMTGRPSGDAARTAVRRALKRLAEAMKRDE